MDIVSHRKIAVEDVLSQSCFGHEAVEKSHFVLPSLAAEEEEVQRSQGNREAQRELRRCLRRIQSAADSPLQSSEDVIDEATQFLMEKQVAFGGFRDVNAAALLVHHSGGNDSLKAEDFFPTTDTQRQNVVTHYFGMTFDPHRCSSFNDFLKRLSRKWQSFAEQEQLRLRSNSERQASRTLAADEAESTLREGPAEAEDSERATQKSKTPMPEAKSAGRPRGRRGRAGDARREQEARRLRSSASDFPLVENFVEAVEELDRSLTTGEEPAIPEEAKGQQTESMSGRIEMVFLFQHFEGFHKKSLIDFLSSLLEYRSRISLSLVFCLSTTDSVLSSILPRNITSCLRMKAFRFVNTEAEETAFYHGSFSFVRLFDSAYQSCGHTPFHNAEHTGTETTTPHLRTNGESDNARPQERLSLAIEELLGGLFLSDKTQKQLEGHFHEYSTSRSSLGRLLRTACVDFFWRKTNDVVPLRLSLLDLLKATLAAAYSSEDTLRDSEKIDSRTSCWQAASLRELESSLAAQIEDTTGGKCLLEQSSRIGSLSSFAPYVRLSPSRTSARGLDNKRGKAASLNKQDVADAHSSLLVKGIVEVARVSYLMTMAANLALSTLDKETVNDEAAVTDAEASTVDFVKHRDKGQGTKLQRADEKTKRQQALDSHSRELYRRFLVSLRTVRPFYDLEASSSTELDTVISSLLSSAAAKISRDGLVSVIRTALLPRGPLSSLSEIMECLRRLRRWLGGTSLLKDMFAPFVAFLDTLQSFFKDDTVSGILSELSAKRKFADITDTSTAAGKAVPLKVLLRGEDAALENLLTSKESGSTSKRTKLLRLAVKEVHARNVAESTGSAAQLDRSGERMVQVIDGFLACLFARALPSDVSQSSKNVSSTVTKAPHRNKGGESDAVFPFLAPHPWTPFPFGELLTVDVESRHLSLLNPSYREETLRGVMNGEDILASFAEDNRAKNGTKGEGISAAIGLEGMNMSVIAKIKRDQPFRDDDEDRRRKGQKKKYVQEDEALAFDVCLVLRATRPLAGKRNAHLQRWLLRFGRECRDYASNHNFEASEIRRFSECSSALVQSRFLQAVGQLVYMGMCRPSKKDGEIELLFDPASLNKYER